LIFLHSAFINLIKSKVQLNLKLIISPIKLLIGLIKLIPSLIKSQNLSIHQLNP
jgi:hypothetical protein